MPRSSGMAWGPPCSAPPQLTADLKAGQRRSKVLLPLSRVVLVGLADRQ